MTVAPAKQPAAIGADTAPFWRDDLMLNGEHFSVLKGPGDVSDPDRPFIIFTHANGFNAQTYRHILAPLTDRFTIWMWDMRGHGFTRAPADARRLKSWTRFRKDLLRLLDMVGRPVFLAGHSLGGMTSFLAAVRRQDQVQGVLGLDPVIMPPGISLVSSVMRYTPFLHMPLEKRALARRAVFDNIDAVVAAYRGRGAFKTWPDTILHDYANGGLVEDGDGVRLACAPAWEAGIYRTVPLFFTREAGLIRCPVTVLHAENSNTFPTATAYHFRRQIKDIRIEAIPGSTHFLPMEFQEKTQDALMCLVENCSETRRNAGD